MDMNKRTTVSSHHVGFRTEESTGGVEYGRRHPRVLSSFSHIETQGNEVLSTALYSIVEGGCVLLPIRAEGSLPILLYQQEPTFKTYHHSFVMVIVRPRNRSRTVDMASRVTAREETRDLRSWLNDEHTLTDKTTTGEQETKDKADDGGEDVVKPAADPVAAPVDPAWRANMLIQILLRAGQASPTHTFVYLDRCSDSD